MNVRSLDTQQKKKCEVIDKNDNQMVIQDPQIGPRRVLIGGKKKEC